MLVILNCHYLIPLILQLLHQVMLNLFLTLNAGMLGEGHFLELNCVYLQVIKGSPKHLRLAFLIFTDLLESLVLEFQLCDLELILLHGLEVGRGF